MVRYFGTRHVLRGPALKFFRPMRVNILLFPSLFRLFVFVCVFSVAALRAMYCYHQEGQDLRGGRRGGKAAAEQEGLAGARRGGSSQGGGAGVRHRLEVRAVHCDDGSEQTVIIIVTSAL